MWEDPNRQPRSLSDPPGDPDHQGWTHGGRQVLVILLELVHELQVLLLLLQLGHALLAALELVLRVGQLVAEPLVLLAQPAHLGPQLLLLRLHGAEVA